MDRITQNMKKRRSERNRTNSRIKQSAILNKTINKHGVKYKRTLSIRSQMIKVYNEKIRKLYEEFRLLIIEYERLNRSIILDNARILQFPIAQTDKIQDQHIDTSSNYVSTDISIFNKHRMGIGHQHDYLTELLLNCHTLIVIHEVPQNFRLNNSGHYSDIYEAKSKARSKTKKEHTYKQEVFFAFINWLQTAIHPKSQRQKAIDKFNNVFNDLKAKLPQSDGTIATNIVKQQEILDVYESIKSNTFLIEM